MRGNRAERLVGAPSSVRFAPEGPRLVRRDQASSYAAWGNVAIVLGREPPDATHVANYRSVILDLLELYPQGIGLVTVVNGTSTPQPSGREALIELFKNPPAGLDATLFIPNATGFRAAVLRSVMGCFILASGQRDRLRVERSVASGVPWLAAKLLGAANSPQQRALLEKGIQRFCDSESAGTPSAAAAPPSGTSARD
jgi:hypothetical protein